MARTWHFHVNLRIAELSLQEEVRNIFKEILNTANDRLPICGLKQSSFSYDLPQDGIAQISGYLHVNKKAKLTEAAVRTWMFDDRIIGDIVWTPIRPGNHGDWKQDSLIRNIFAACERRDCGTDTGTRRLEDWVGKSSDEIDRGGRPRYAGADAAGADIRPAAAAAEIFLPVAAALPARPPPVAVAAAEIRPPAAAADIRPATAGAYAAGADIRPAAAAAERRKVP